MRRGVKYLFLGKSGAILLGFPDTTQDVDLFPQKSAANGQALVDALKKKQYAAFTASTTPDKLFHVQVGPFGDLKDAEATKAKLVSDGYNPILKR